MSWTKEVTLWCDHPDCYAWEMISEGATSVSLARRAARQRFGWRYNHDTGDRCPEHIVKP